MAPDTRKKNPRSQSTSPTKAKPSNKMPRTSNRLLKKADQRSNERKDGFNDLQKESDTIKQMMAAASKEEDMDVESDPPASGTNNNNKFAVLESDSEDEEEDEEVLPTEHDNNVPSSENNNNNPSEPSQHEETASSTKANKNKKITSSTTTTSDTTTASTKPKKSKSKKNKKPSKSSDPKQPDTGDKSSKSNTRVSFGGTHECNPKDLILREEDAFANLIVAPPPNVKVAQRVPTMLGMGKFIFNTLLSIDPSITLCKHADTPREDLTVADTIGAGSDTPFPAMLSDMKKWFQGIHVRDSPKLFVQVRIGANADIAEVISDANAILQGSREDSIPHSCNANLCIKHLQHACTCDAVWIAGLFSSVDITDFQNIVQESLDTYLDIGKLQTPIDIAIRAKNVRLDFNKKGNKLSKKHKEEKEVKTFHIEVRRGVEQTATRFIFACLKNNPALAKCSNAKLTVVSVVNKDSSPKDVEFARQALAHHKNMLDSIDSSAVPNVADPNVRSKRAGNKSTREMLLDLDRPSAPGSKVFLQVETSHNGVVHIFHAKKWEAEAKHVIKHLLLCLGRKHPDAGNAIHKGFTPEAIEEAKDHCWDDDNNCPTSKLAQAMDQQLADAKEDCACWLFENLDLIDNDKKNTNKKDFAPARPSTDDSTAADGSFVTHRNADEATEAAGSRATSSSATDASATSSEEASASAQQGGQVTVPRPFHRDGQGGRG